MELEYLGANCIKITTKKATFLVDDNSLEKIGAKLPPKTPQVRLYSTSQEKPGDAEFVFDSPGEYEVYDVSIQGIAAQGFADPVGAKSATIFRLVVDDIRIGIVGNISSEVNDDQLESIGTIDVMVVPVGGSGITLDGVGALKLIKKIEPKIVIPIYYADKGLRYEVPPMELETALKDLSMEITEKQDKLKLKGKDFPEITQLYILNRQ